MIASYLPRTRSHRPRVDDTRYIVIADRIPSVSAPNGWTSDMTIVLGNGTVGELVDFIIETGLAGADPQQTCGEIQARFRISPEDAELAMDRTYGGIVRAKTKNPLNRPDPETDPIAFESYERARRDETIIQRLEASSR